MIGVLERSKEDILELIADVRVHQNKKSLQYAAMTYEEGIQNTLKWLFYNKEPLPTDITAPKKYIPPVIDTNVPEYGFPGN